MLYLTPWVMRIIIANAVVFILTLAAPYAINHFALIPSEILLRPWTIVTYMFLHGGFGHIFFNMLALFFFGPRLEAELGGKNFLLLYFVSGISGAFLSFFTPTVAIIGASGAVYGVMLGYAYLWPRDRVFIWGLFPVQVRFLVILMTGLSLFGGFGIGSAGIAHFAHLGGFLGGLVVMRLLHRPGQIRPAVQQAGGEPAVSTADFERWKLIQREKLHIVNREEYDRIMVKLSSLGAASLTPQEITFLNRFSAQ
jgi:membrane associated rhomboid family serine protease